MASSRTTESSSLAERVAKARSEGRTQQALEFAKQLAKNEPTEAHRELVRTVSVERGCQLMKDGKPRDAITAFKNALQGETPTAFRAQIAAKLAEAGDIAAALEIFHALPDSPERTRVFTRAVDAAVVAGQRNALPPDVHAAFDAVRTAFERVEQGQDDAAREALQAIGLSSPFLEWKVMIRGLIAFHQNDDVRAQDNWQRLDPDRQPWRLVAPFRFQIDRGFREAQPPAAQQTLRTLATRLGNNHLVVSLRRLAPAFGSWKEEKRAQNALRLLDDFVREYGAANPALLVRLGQLVAVKIITEGNDNDIDFFRWHFKAPADDPHLHRLTAQMGESTGDPNDSVKAWLAYEKDIAALPDRYPGETGRLARALIFEQIARTVGEFDPDSVPKWAPSLAECCRKSAELVPTRVEPHLLLVQELRLHPKRKREALAAAKELVKKFPDHVPTWEILAESSFSARQYPSAIDAMRNVLRIDPLRPGARQKLAEALWDQAFKVAKGKSPKPEKYRPLLEESIRLHETPLAGRLMTWSILELGLGHNDEGNRLRDLALERPQHRLAVPLAFHVAAMVVKSASKEFKATAKSDWLEALRQPPTLDEAFAALETLGFVGGRRVTGKAALIKSLFPQLTDRALEPLSRDQLLRLGRLLIDVDHRPGVRAVSRHASARFPADPLVCFLEFDAVDVDRGYAYGTITLLRNLLEKTRQLAEKLPREAKERVLDEIRPREKVIEDLQRRHGLDDLPGMERFFGQMMDRLLDDEDGDEPLL